MIPFVTETALGGAGAVASIWGAEKDRKAASVAADRNEALQREFAQHGIRWKVEDAKRAGIHPLTALGASTIGAAPVAAGGDFGGRTGEALSGMGQDVSRAIQSTRTAEERQLATFQLRNAELDIEGKEIDNQIRATQLQKMSQVGPALPSNSGLPSSLLIPGQGDSGPRQSAAGYVMEKAAERTHSAPGHPGQQVGHVADLGWATADDGTLYPIPSKDVKEQIEDQIIPETMWAMRNYIQANFQSGSKPPKHLLPPGFRDWEWSYKRQGYVPVRRKPRGFEQKFDAYFRDLSKIDREAGRR